MTLSAVDASYLNSVRPDVVEFFRQNGWDTQQSNWPRIFDHWFANTMRPTDYPRSQYSTPDEFVAALRAGRANPNSPSVVAPVASPIMGTGTTRVYSRAPASQSEYEVATTWLKDHPFIAMGIVAVGLYLLLGKPKGQVAFNQ